jgi:hypothetical protein
MKQLLREPGGGPPQITSDAAGQNNVLEGYLTAKETAAMLRISKTLFSKIVNGRVKDSAVLPHIRIGRKLYCLKESVEFWLREREKQCSMDRSKS